MGIPVKLIVIDTLSRAMAGGNENAPEDMGALVRHQDEIRAGTGACLLWIHHSGKDAAKGARGHSLLRAAIDTEIEVTADESGQRLATISKQRDLESGAKFAFTLKVIELGENARGKAITSCVIDHGDPDAPAPKTLSRLSGHARDAMELLQRLMEATNAVSIPEDQWRHTFYSETMPGADQSTRKKAFRRAADQLLSMKRIAFKDGFVWTT